MSDIKLDIGKRIIEARSKLGLTASALAKKANISRARLNNWEAGRRTPGLDESKTIAEILNSSPAYLLCLTDINHIERSDKSNIKNMVCKGLPVKNKESLLLGTTTDEYLPVPQIFESIIKDDVFLFNLFDTSMEPIFTEGDFVAITPGTTPSHGDFVLIKIEKSHQVLFRKYIIDNSNLDAFTIKLQPLNSEWPEITTTNEQQFTLIGVMSRNGRVFF